MSIQHCAKGQPAAALRSIESSLWLSRPVHISLHRLFLTLDRLHQLELRPAPIQVVGRAVNAEIGIAAEVISQKPNADLEGDELAGKSYIGLFCPRQELARSREIAFR